MSQGPATAVVVAIPAKKIATEQGSEYHLTVTAVLKERALWADAGHVVATEQFALPWTVRQLPIARSQSIPPLSLEEHGNDVLIAGKTWQITFDKSTGLMTSWTDNGEQRDRRRAHPQVLACTHR